MCTVCSILSVRAGFRVPSVCMFMGLILPWIELGSCSFVGVFERLCLRFIILWADKEMTVRSPEHGTVPKVGLSIR